MRPGEVHALVGENGAGKSTLMKIVSGVYQADAGEISFKGQPVAFRNPRQAQDAGIVTIYQELNLVPYQSITENIFLGSELTRGRVALRWSDMHQQARELLAKLHLNVDPRTLVGELGVGKQQMVEVAKAIYHKADLIIMDEPTSSLSIREINDLFDIVRELKEQGVSVTYISHHLEEVFQISDRTTVLRDGQLIKTLPTPQLNVDSLIRLMVGRDLSEQFPKEVAPRGKEVLRVEDLNRGMTLRDINFSAYAGEVLGVAGLVGAGRTELVRAIFGADRIDSGRFYLDGEQITIKSSRDAVHHGIGLLTEDRKRQGLFLQMNVRENITMSVLERLTRGMVTNRKREATLSQEYIDSLAIKTSGQDQLAINLSGGTQQKVVLSKWLATEPRVLIFDEPTRGIDVGAKVEIYRMMNDLARQGVAIIMVSSELPEILGMSDRVMVVAGGRIRGFLDRAEASEERIMELATATDRQTIAEVLPDLVEERSSRPTAEQFNDKPSN
ncbi:MAG: sugar ABC transporter ATP-binding protein [Caldilineales bacterium]